MLDPTTLSSLKVTELKAELKRRGLPVGGLKQALVDRLADDITKELEKANALELEAEEAVAPADEFDDQAVENDEPPTFVEPVVEPERAETPTPSPAFEPEPVHVREAIPVPQQMAREPTPEAEPMREPTPEPEPEQVVRDATPEPELMLEPTPVPEQVQAEDAMPDVEPVWELAPVQAEESMVEAEVEREPTLVIEKVQAREVTPEVEPEQDEPEVEEPVLQMQEISTTEVAKEELEIATRATEPEEQDVQEQHEPPVQPEETVLTPEAEEMHIDAIADGTLEDTVTAPLEPTKLEQPLDEDVSMSETSPEAPLEVPIDTPIEDPVQSIETQSSAAEVTEVTTATTITPQSDLVVPLATSEPMDTNEDFSTDLRKRKRRSASPPLTTDTPSSASAPPELPAPLDDEEEGSVSKRPRQASPPKPRQRDARFKGLFNNGDSLPATEPEATDDARDSAAHDDDDEPPVKPSLHPATRAIYIRNLVRPINEPALRAHLISLATGPTTATPAVPEQIDSFFVDTVKSHALITFASITAATRVRVGVHGKVWPNDRTRKPLWVDFIPEEKVDSWVETERAGGRWEVAYTVDSGVDGGCQVELVELGGGAGGRAGGRGAGGRDAARAAAELVGVPTGPRGGRERKNSGMCTVAHSTTPRSGLTQHVVLAVQKAPPVAALTGETTTTTTTTKPRIVDLDELFKSTRAKPKLYYMPVSEATARERLAVQRRDSRGRH